MSKQEIDNLIDKYASSKDGRTIYVNQENFDQLRPIKQFGYIIQMIIE